MEGQAWKQTAYYGWPEWLGWDRHVDGAAQRKQKEHTWGGVRFRMATGFLFEKLIG